MVHSDEGDDSGRAVDWDAPDFWLDASHGHGAFSREEDWARSTGRDGSNDGRGYTETTFYASDVDSSGPGQLHRDPEDRRSWGDLAKWNDGMYSDKSRGGQNFRADKSRWLDTFADRLGASEYHRSRAEYVLEEVDMAPFNAAHIPVECLIIAVLSFFIDREVEVHPGEDPEEAMSRRTIERESTNELLAALDLERDDVVQTRKLLREHAGDLVLGD